MADALLERAAEAHLAVAQAMELYETTRKQRKNVIEAAYAEGHTMETIAEVTGISKTRVQRILKGNQPKRRRLVLPDL